VLLIIREDQARRSARAMNHLNKRATVASRREMTATAKTCAVAKAAREKARKGIGLGSV
jgi:hypothetical protein